MWDQKLCQSWFLSATLEFHLKSVFQEKRYVLPLITSDFLKRAKHLEGLVKTYSGPDFGLRASSFDTRGSDWSLLGLVKDRN